ncbi:SAM-dependent methyltransferase [Actinomadura graeca]|uniref:SAM-dependent methyltransferase n=1 Tax=Actinomadura graeca TaxID=2750812 RepID=A0ABX8R864_9ACTN|nr:SAM-dependent methyltransferase [Actinomadura graeca]QXJ26167.1 SAM-dependent methyltransferase [Actinomadura graeca]
MTADPALREARTGAGAPGVRRRAEAPEREPLALHRPGPARVHDYLLGGKDNYAPDRRLAQRILRVLPQSAAAARDGRAFLARAVRELAARGIRQFVDLGCGLPAAVNLHQMAARHAPGTRVLYVDDDPLVLAHARALLIEDGNIAVLRGDLRDPAAIADGPDWHRLIDPREPVALVFSSVLHFLRDPYGPVAALGAVAPPGSALVVSHATADFDPGTGEAARLYNEASLVPLLPRRAADIERLLGPFTPLAPGVVPVAHWRPDAPSPPSGPPLMYGGVGIRAARTRST